MSDAESWTPQALEILEREGRHVEILPWSKAYELRGPLAAILAHVGSWTGGIAVESVWQVTTRDVTRV